jgi:hypothetical protein
MLLVHQVDHEAAAIQQDPTLLHIGVTPAVKRLDVA